MSKLRVLDLFSGIGGFSLGLERTGGFETVAFCEIDPFCQRVLKKHWPDVPIYNDVRNLEHDGAVDVITGGFPCQDMSQCGRKLGIEDGERSGLWKFMFQAIGRHKPKYVIIENVTGLITGESGRWFAKLLSDLAIIGYDAQWHCISIADIGGGCQRRRIWFIAYPNQNGWLCAEKIYNSIAFQISQIRTPRSVLALLAHYKRVQIKKIYPDHRKLDGLSDAVDSVERLGNTVSPIITKIIGHAILAAEAA